MFAKEQVWGFPVYKGLKNKVLEFRKNIPCDTICEYSAIKKEKLKNYEAAIVS